MEVLSTAHNCKHSFLPFIIVGGEGEVRTHARVTAYRISNAAPLPLGYSSIDKIMELAVGFEPTTCRLQGGCTAIVLHQHQSRRFF